MVARAFSATIVAFSAGTSAAEVDGTARGGFCVPREITSVVAVAYGNDRSTPLDAYAVISSPLLLFALAAVYLPRLNPAKGMGRSDFHLEISTPLRSAFDSSFPVARSFHSVGASNSR